MANAEHLAILKEGVEVWNMWRKENEGIRPELNGAWLNDSNLDGVDFSVVDLHGAHLSNCDFERANLRSANLSHADLSGAYIWHTSLHRANLRYSDLTNAYIQRSDLSNTDLLGSNLSIASLSDSNLYGANLTDSNLYHAFLNRANLTGANLTNTYLGGAHLGGTTFGLTCLGTCRGLESVEVISPCVIDFETLRASRNLPKSFLLKIGLPELFIDYLPDFFQPEGIRYYPVFLSHSWANKPFARKLYEALIAKGVNVFFDEKQLKPGDDIFTSLSRGIELYDKTILVCSEDSLNSWWVDQELELVFEKERNLQKEVGEKTGLLIPIRIDDYIDTWPNGKRMAIKQRIIGDFRNWQDDAAFEKALNDLIHALNADRPEVKPVSLIRRS